ncbi:MAG: hypothetical protein ABSD47_17510 [Candidatus Methylomirabilota bacterium]
MKITEAIRRPAALARAVAEKDLGTPRAVPGLDLVGSPGRANLGTDERIGFQSAEAGLA